jgi:plastocyanin
MRRFLSIFVALAMVFSLFAGVGAHPAKAAAATLTVTSAGNFTGGVDAMGAAPVNAVGTVVSSSLNSAVVNVTSAGVGTFDPATPNVSVMMPQSLTTTSTDADWATPGTRFITFTAGTLPIVGDEVHVTATGAPAVGTVLMVGTTDITGLTTDQVKVTTAYAGTMSGAVSVMRSTTLTFENLNSIDENWRTVGTAQPVTFTGMVGTLAVGDRLEVSMVQLQPAIPAYAFLTIGGTITAGDVATVTWQDTTGASHTASYMVSGDTLASVTTRLTTTINAVAGGNVIATSPHAYVLTLTQTVAGTAGNGKTLTAGTTATDTALTIYTLGGLTSPAYAEEGKTIQLVAVDPTGAIVAATWAPALPTNGTPATSATIDSDGLVTAWQDSGVTLITARYGTFSGSFVVIDASTQAITSLAVKLVPAALKVTGKQQLGAVAASTAHIALDYTTQTAWTDTLPVAGISAQGLLTYSRAETGNVAAHAGGLTSTVAATIDASGVVTIKTIPVAVKKRGIVLTIGADIVTVDGKATSIDAAPEIVGGRTFVPVRFIAETFSSTVTWLPETRGITVVLGSTTIGLQIGNKTAVINSNIVALDAAPYIKNSRTMVPLRVISESFGGDVAWDPSLRTITITHLLP